MPNKKDHMDIDHIGEKESEESWERKTGETNGGEKPKMTKAV